MLSVIVHFVHCLESINKSVKTKKLSTKCPEFQNFNNIYICSMLLYTYTVYGQRFKTQTCRLKNLFLTDNPTGFRKFCVPDSDSWHRILPGVQAPVLAILTGQQPLIRDDPCHFQSFNFFIYKFHNVVMVGYDC